MGGMGGRGNTQKHCFQRLSGYSHARLLQAAVTFVQEIGNIILMWRETINAIAVKKHISYLSNNGKNDI